MKIKFILNFIPVLIFYVDSISKNRAGVSYGLFVKILKEYKNDEGLIQHELTHCRQFYRTLFIHGVLYKFWSHYRYISEVEAYAVQLKYYKEERINCLSLVYGKSIAVNYNLDVTRYQSMFKILSYYNKYKEDSSNKPHSMLQYLLCTSIFFTVLVIIGVICKVLFTDTIIYRRELVLSIAIPTFASCVLGFVYSVKRLWGDEKGTKKLNIYTGSNRSSLPNNREEAGCTQVQYAHEEENNE